jgi:tetratricopeptide (TPR) repeat protein
MRSARSIELRFTLVLAYGRSGALIGRSRSSSGSCRRIRRVLSTVLARTPCVRRGKCAGDRALREALARDPHFVRAHDNLGLCYEQLDDPDRAIQHYREAVRLNREVRTRSPWPPTNLAALLRQRGQEETDPLLHEALEYDEGFAKGHYELGVLLDEQGKTAASVQELERAVALDGTYPEPHYVLARIYRRQGDAARADEALAAFKRLRAAREQGAK